MRHDKLENQLELLILLTDNRRYGMKELCQRIGIERRNFYYYLEFFRNAGFKVEKYGDCYSIDRTSPFFGRIIERISFSDEEVIVIRRLLNKVRGKNAVVEALKRKLDRMYDFNILDSDETSEKASKCISRLHEAIKHERQVVLRQYSSPHSKTKRDRLVEPFLLMNGNREVRCFEPASGLNKTFNISRMDDVDVLAENWMHTGEHREMHTDIFMFSADRTMRVELLLGQLSRDILVEEYPRALSFITQQDKSTWLLSLDVCSYLGIGRFVLGLFDDIQVLGDEGFIAFLKQKLLKFNSLAQGDGRTGM